MAANGRPTTTNSTSAKALTPNTPVSIALVIFIIGGVLTIYGLVSDIKTTTAAQMADLQSRIAVVEMRQSTQKQSVTELKSAYRQDIQEIKAHLLKMNEAIQKVQANIAYIRAKIR